MLSVKTFKYPLAKLSLESNIITNESVKTRNFQSTNLQIKNQLFI